LLVLPCRFNADGARGGGAEAFAGELDLALDAALAAAFFLPDRSPSLAVGAGELVDDISADGDDDPAGLSSELPAWSAEPCPLDDPALLPLSPLRPLS